MPGKVTSHSVISPSRHLLNSYDTKDKWMRENRKRSIKFIKHTAEFSTSLKFKKEELF